MIENDVQLRQTRRALELLETGLADLKKRISNSDPELFEAMAASHLKDIDRLRQEIDEYTGVTLAQTQRADFWVRLKGPNIEYHDTSVKIISDWISKINQSFRTALYKISGIGSIPDLRFAAVTDGSFGIGFKLPKQLFIEKNYPEEALSKLSLAAVCLALENPEAELLQNFPDPKERKIYLETAMDLIPSKKSNVEAVELTGVLVRKFKKGLSPNLIPEHRDKGNAILKKLSEISKDEEERVVLRGWLFKVNCDNNTFWLKNIREKFRFEPLLAAKIKDVLDFDKEHPQRAEVMGVRKKGFVQVVSITKMEE